MPIQELEVQLLILLVVNVLMFDKFLTLVFQPMPSLAVELLKVPFVTNTTILESSPEKNVTRFQLSILKNRLSEVTQSLEKLKVDNVKSQLEAEDDLVITALVSNKAFPVRESIDPVVLSCEFRAPEGFQVQWYKVGD